MLQDMELVIQLNLLLKINTATSISKIIKEVSESESRISPHIFEETPAHWAVKESQMWAFQTLLKEGALIDFKTVDGDTLGHYAVGSIGNAPQFLRILASKGADLNAPNKSGKTIMKIAQEKNLTRAINTLIELGIKKEEGLKTQATSKTAETQPKKVNCQFNVYSLMLP